MLRLLNTSKLISTASSRTFAKTVACLYSTEQAKSKSMTPAGTKLKGLNIKKNGEDPVALEDEEYPPWLWEVLDKQKQQAKLQANPEKAAHSKRRQANRQHIKSDNFLRGMDN